MANGDREDPPLSYRKLKSNGSAGRAEERIEEMRGLPTGSDRIMNPSGRDGNIDLRDAMTRTWIVRGKPGAIKRVWKYGSVDGLVEAGCVIQ